MSIKLNHNIGFIGGGNMATSLIGGLISNATCKPEQVTVFEPNADKAAQLEQEFGLNIATSNSQLLAASEIVVVAVKPQVLRKVLEPLAADFNQQKHLLISVVAGIQAASIERWLQAKLPIVRVMPNTPALIGAGASGLYANQHVSQAQKEATMALLSSVGIAEWVALERDIDSVTALSGSGPAYFMLFIQSLIEAGIESGLAPATAKNLALATAKGTAELVESSEHSLQTLIDNVTSPNGTTEQALKTFHELGLPNIVRQAFEAARTRSQELAKELG